MRYIFTLVLFSSIVTYGYSDPKKPKKPKGCDKYSCNDYNWNHKIGFFDPHTLQWPIHYNGEIYKDKADGGDVDIYVAVGHYDHKKLISLKDYRHHYNDPWFLDKGLAMNDEFECEAYFHDEPHWKDSECAQVFAGFEDKYISFDGTSCGKIIREWTAIDWCKYEPNTVANSRPERYVLVKDLVDQKVYWSYGPDHYDIEHDGWYTFQQVVKIVDHYPPDLKSCDDVEFDLNGKCNGRFWYKNSIYDAGPCPGEKTQIELTLYDQWDDIVLQDWTNALRDNEFNIDLGHLYAGVYTAHLELRDGCGNTNKCVQKIMIKDKNPPHLICIQDLSVSIADDYGVSIWAKDFVHKVQGPCYDNTLTYSFDKNEEVPSLTFNCPDGPGVQDLEVFVTGSNGVKTSCNVTLMVADHNQCFENAVVVAGQVVDWRGFPIAGAEVQVYGDQEYRESGMTNERGFYGVPPVELNFSKGELIGTVADKSTKGIDAFDLIAMLRHIQGVELLKDVKQRAAADINSDGEINLVDYWALTDILYDLPKINTDYEAWKFFDEKLEFSGLTNHMSYFRPARMAWHRRSYNLKGVKTGDLNLSYRPDPVASNRSIERAASSYTQRLNEGIHTVTVDVPSRGQVKSLSLSIGGLTMDDIQSISVQDQELAFVVEYIEDQSALIILSDESLTGETLTIVTKSDLTLNQGMLYDTDGDESVGIQWELQELSATEGALAQVYPNPFDEFVRVDFTLDKDSEVELNIFDASGQRVFVRSYTENAGRGTIELDLNQFRQGLYMMTVQSDEFSISRKIIKI